MMRRWLVIFLLLCMPLQFAWAAAGVYCQHENGAAAKHFGHHEHEHHADANTPDPTGSGGIDGDCGACHAGCVSVLTGTLRMSGLPLAAQADFDYQAPSPALLFDLPERPQWSVSA